MPADVAVMVACIVAFTGAVDIKKVALVMPPGTVSTGGCGCACASLLFSVTMTPVIGAGAVSVTNAVTWLPPVTMAWFRVTPSTCGVIGGFTEMDAVFVMPGYKDDDAVIKTVFDLVTGCVVMVNGALACPALSVNDEG